MPGWVPVIDVWLPEGARLLHIGPPKTGTSALQGALRQARPALAEHQVVYPGKRTQHSLAARAVVGGKGLKGDPPASMRHWERLVRQVTAADDQRVIVSSEGFCGASADVARKDVEQLGGPRVHVLVTLRPLGKMMPSAWQQYVRNGLTVQYIEWLEEALKRAPDPDPTGTFWRRHRHDALVERWASIVGPQNLTVVVLDDSDRSMLLRTFERLVGLPSGLLEFEAGWTNRSLTVAEIELLRRLNIEFKRRGWPDDVHRAFVRVAVTRQLHLAHQPTSGEPRITTPVWALERAARIGADAASKISALGVRVVGDISTLGAMPTPAADVAAPAEPDVPVVVVKEAVLAIIAASLSTRNASTVASLASPTAAVRAIPSRELVGIVLQRAQRRATGPSWSRAASRLAAPAPDAELVLPMGARLLHIGPHKTGTTALQAALSQARRAMTAHGVVYPGAMGQHFLAARAVTGVTGPKGDPSGSLQDWTDLLEEVDATDDQRVIVSSETFANAETEDARRIVEELGGPRVHVLVTLRPLAKIMPSAWQQYVREGMRVTYDEWLDGMLNRPPYNKPTPTFWHRHQHDALVERWASIVGPQNLTVLVLDESDRSRPLRTVEKMAGLPTGMLKVQPSRTNRSLTLGEIELIRQLNIEFKRRAWSDDLHRTFVRLGMTKHLQEAHQPAPNEPQITTPDWALERAAHIGSNAADKISTLGVRVIGDLSSLGATMLPESVDVSPSHVPDVPIFVATEAVVGTIKANGPVLSSITSRALVGILVRRARDPLGRLPAAGGSRWLARLHGWRAARHGVR